MPHSSQEAAIEALRHGAEDVARMREQYAKRRDFVVRRFNEMGLSVIYPEAHSMLFLLYLRARDWMRLNFAIVSFGSPKLQWSPEPHLVRMVKGMFVASFSTSYEKLVEATNRMERFIDQVRAESETVPRSRLSYFLIFFNW